MIVGRLIAAAVLIVCGIVFLASDSYRFTAAAKRAMTRGEEWDGAEGDVTWRFVAGLVLITVGAAIA